MKKRFIITFGLVLSLVFSAQVFAATPNKPTIFENFNLVYDGEIKTFEKNAPVLNLNGRTMLPLAYMFDMVNTDKSGTINWDGQQRMVTMTNKGTTIKLWIGKPDAEVNGNKVSVGDASPIIYNDRTYVPMGFVGRNFDLVINWDQDTRTAFVAQNSTLNQIADLLVKANTEYDKTAKLSYTMMDFTDYEIDTEKETVELSYLTQSNVKQDKQDFFTYMTYASSSPWDFLKAEVYDDGVNLYMAVENNVYKGATNKEFDLKTGLYLDIANDKKNLYSFLLDTTDGENFIRGYANPSYEPVSLTIDRAIGGIISELEDLEFEEIENTYVTEPVLLYKINKEGQLIMVSIYFEIGFEAEVDGEMATIVVNHDLIIGDITPNITLNKTIPDSIKKNAK